MNNIKLDGKILFLTNDRESIIAQLSGDGFAPTAAILKNSLMDDISTDEMTPGWCCYRHDKKIADYAYLGLRNGAFKEGDFRRFSPQVVVSGRAKGCGSSRENAAYAEKYAGVEIVFAKSFSKIYEQNCRNIGIITSTDFSLLERLIAGESIAKEQFLANLNAFDREIVKAGGLINFSKRTGDSDLSEIKAIDLDLPEAEGNLVQQIVSTNLSKTRANNSMLPTLRKGATYFIDADIRFSHEYVSAMAATIFQENFGPQQTLVSPESCYFFQDHLSLVKPILARRPKGAELIPLVETLNTKQIDFCSQQQGNFVGLNATGGSQAICHNYVLEKLALPGHVIVGTDSHTCTAGAIGALAFGIGATDMANAWFNKKVQFRMPDVIGVELTGAFGRFSSAKDAMLQIFTSDIVRSGEINGTILHFTGPGCASINMDERATFCNMSVEAGAITALFSFDQVSHRYLLDTRDLDWPVVVEKFDETVYKRTIRVSLDSIGPMISFPGDPKNAHLLNSVTKKISINRTYGGSCTGGKKSDMDMYAMVYSLAKQRGLKVNKDVEAYIQVGSQMVFEYARSRGYIDLFKELGAIVLEPSCGACINAGPGVSETADDVTVSAQNRNFNGRSGPGKVYLASPYVVAASSFAGFITSVDNLLLADQ
jgi:3-isopropylmalate/(R)-2-methylmalate dehydratase large subunit